MRAHSLSTAAAFAAAVLAGHITDRTTGQPIAGVHVVVSGPTNAKATTDKNGAYTIRGLRPGTYAVTLSSDDVPPQHASVHVTAGTTNGDAIVCSTTLDYSCAPGGDGPGR